MTNDVQIALDICILVCSSAGSLISAFVLILIIYHRQQHPINNSVLLLCNTYFAIMFTCLNFVIMYAYSLHGDLYKNVDFNDWWCYLHSYIVHVGLCSIYQSFLLQSCFRFFRVVFHRNRQLQNMKFIFGSILCQWILSFLFMMIIFLLQYIVYLPDYYHCQVSFSNFFGLFLTIAMIYFGPTTISTVLYMYLMYYLKHNQVNTRNSNKRDLMVLRRIIILILSILFLSLPTLILWLFYIITGQLYYLSYHLEWFLFSLSLSILSVASAVLSPHFSRLLQMYLVLDRRVHPMGTNTI